MKQLFLIAIFTVAFFNCYREHLTRDGKSTEKVIRKKDRTQHLHSETATSFTASPLAIVEWI